MDFKTINNNLCGIDLFSGAGGMSIGAEMAGIRISHAVESNKYAAETFEANHKNVNVIQEDIRKVTLKGQSNPFVVFGGPPCQGFSLSNTRTRNDENKNNTLFFEFVRFVQELNPVWFIFENVEGIKSYKNGETVKILQSIFEKLGYKVKFDILYASDYGVPQKRNRFFMVGNRINIDYSFPAKLEKKVSVHDALFDLPDLGNGDSFQELPYKTDEKNDYTKVVRNGTKLSFQNFVSRNEEYVIERYKYIKPGQNWRAIPANLMENYKDKTKCHSGIYKRLLPDEPSVVISNYRKNMLIHPYVNRGLSVREAARLQSFPDDFIFKGSLTYIQQQIGNAVPPLLAYHIFKSIIDQNNGE